MNTRFLLRSGALAAALAVTGAAQASTITDVFGDIDCFGTGLVCADGAFGAGDFAAFSTFTGAMTPDATSPATDTWSITDEQTWDHGLLLSGAETLANLEFRTYAMADQRGPYDIFINGSLIGTTSIVDTGAVFSSQQIVTHSFDFSAALLVSGANTVTMTKLAGGGDSWALDYSQLSASTAVPEPATLGILGLGLLGLGAMGRKRAA